MLGAEALGHCLQPEGVQGIQGGPEAHLSGH